jgi:hypothetical protein
MYTIQVGGGNQQETVNKVYWTTEEKVVSTDENGNPVETETVLKDVTHDKQEVQFDGSFPMQEITLRNHEEPTQVTMWIDGEDDARWTFTHQSIGTTESAGIDSVGDYWVNALMDFLLPISGGLFVIGILTRAAVERAGVGPRWGFVTWALLLLGGSMVGLMMYSDLANLLVDAPFIASGLILAISGVVMLETWNIGLRKYLFLQMETEHATTPSGEEALDSVWLDAETHRVIEVNGIPAIVKRGLFPFFSRVTGKAAYINDVAALDTEIKMPNSSWDRCIVVNSDSEEIVDYKSEGWEFNIPDPEEIGWVETALKLSLYSLAMYVLSTLVGGIVMVAGMIIITAIAYMRPRDGYANIVPASIHERTAVATVMYYNIIHDEAETIEALRKSKWQVEGKNEQDVEHALDERDATLIETAFGKEDEARSDINEADMVDRLNELEEESDDE